MGTYHGEEYYRVNKILMTLICHWPYENEPFVPKRAYFYTILVSSFIFFSLSKLYVTGESSYLLELLPQCLVCGTCLITTWNGIIKIDEIQDILEMIERNWADVQDEEEEKIIRSHAARGRDYTKGYIIVILTTATLYISGYVVIPLMNIILPLNETRPLQQSYVMEYFVDEQKYFYEIAFHQITTLYVCMALLITTDTTYMFFMEHACGMFATMSYKLKTLYEHYARNASNLSEVPMMCRDPKLARSIEYHRRTIDFIGKIQSMVSVTFITQLGFDIICLSSTLFKMSAVGIHDEFFLTSCSFVIAQFFHLYCKCFPSQNIIDLSDRMREDAFATLWYETPIAVQKLIIHIIRRTQVPCYISAAGLFVYSRANFTAAVQTSVSYYTVMTSTY